MAGMSTGTAMLVAGGSEAAMSGAGQIMSGIQKKNAYDYNAQIDLDNMKTSMQSNQQKYTQQIGRQRSAYAASGVDIASGSPLLLMAATAARGGAQGEQIEEAGTEAAAMQRYYGKIAAFSGTMSGIGSFMEGLDKSFLDYGKIAPSVTKPKATDQ